MTKVTVEEQEPVVVVEKTPIVQQPVLVVEKEKIVEVEKERPPVTITTTTTEE